MSTRSPLFGRRRPARRLLAAALTAAFVPIRPTENVQVALHADRFGSPEN